MVAKQAKKPYWARFNTGRCTLWITLLTAVPHSRSYKYMLRYFVGGVMSRLSPCAVNRVELWEMTSTSERLLYSAENVKLRRSALRVQCVEWLQKNGFRVPVEHKKRKGAQ